MRWVASLFSHVECSSLSAARAKVLINERGKKIESVCVWERTGRFSLCAEWAFSEVLFVPNPTPPQMRNVLYNNTLFIHQITFVSIPTVSTQYVSEKWQVELHLPLRVSSFTLRDIQRGLLSFSRLTRFVSPVFHFTSLVVFFVLIFVILRFSRKTMIFSQKGFGHRLRRRGLAMSFVKWATGVVYFSPPFPLVSSFHFQVLVYCSIPTCMFMCTCVFMPLFPFSKKKLTRSIENEPASTQVGPVFGFTVWLIVVRATAIWRSLPHLTEWGGLPESEAAAWFHWRREKSSSNRHRSRLKTKYGNPLSTFRPHKTILTAKWRGECDRACVVRVSDYFLGCLFDAVSTNSHS